LNSNRNLYRNRNPKGIEKENKNKRNASCWNLFVCAFNSNNNSNKNILMMKMRFNLIGNLKFKTGI
jgi:hypothetical protein